MSDLYVAAVRDIGAPLEVLESSMGAGELPVVTLGMIRVSGGMTRDQALLAAHALESLGVLRRAGHHWMIIPGGLQRTAGFRQGVRAASRSLSVPSPTAEILARCPPGAPARLSEVVARTSMDLRFGVLSLITEAQEELLLMSPFWDRSTLADFVEPLRARLQAGVRVTLVARRIGREFDYLRRELGEDRGLKLLEWFSIDPAGAVVTFHLKAIVQDRGQRAYIGSANMTSAGLRSRVELGLRFDGELARRVADIVYAAAGAGVMVGRRRWRLDE